MTAVWMGALLASIAITKMDFSVDDGKTWTPDPPIVYTDNPRFQVRLERSGGDIRPLDNGGIISVSLKTNRDFASADSKDGRIFARGPELKRWTYLFQPPIPYVFKVDLGPRPAGVMRRWPKKEAPAIDGWKPGCYGFSVEMFYRLADKTPVRARDSFMVLVRDASERPAEDAQKGAGEKNNLKGKTK